MKSSVGHGSSDVIPGYKLISGHGSTKNPRVFSSCLCCWLRRWGPLAAKFRLCLGRLTEVFQLHRDVLIPWFVHAELMVQCRKPGFRVSPRRVQDFRLECGSLRSRQIDGESLKDQQECPSLTWCSSSWVFFGLGELNRWYNRGLGESQFLSENHKIDRCFWMV